jgi:hypothetical protein
LTSGTIDQSSGGNALMIRVFESKVSWHSFTGLGWKIPQPTLDLDDHPIARCCTVCITTISGKQSETQVAVEPDSPTTTD